MSGDDDDSQNKSARATAAAAAPGSPLRISKPPLPLPEPHDDDNNDHHETDDDDDAEEHHELVNLSGDNQSMSIGGTSDDGTDDLSLRRWRTTNIFLRGGGNKNQSREHYEYDYLDEDVLGHSRGCCYFFSISAKVKLLFALFLVISVVALFIPNGETVEETKPVARKYKGAPQYVCPAVAAALPEATSGSSGSNSNTVLDQQEPFSMDHVFRDYRNNSALINLVTNNMTYYRENFRELEYMNWNKSYNEVKEGMKHWKVSRYLPNMKTGDSIFESGCGIGLNLLLTLELLQQENVVRDLHLYGTDFGVAAAVSANVLLDAVLQEAASVGGGKRGAVCAADSTQLAFVPDNSFDFVFSSRISPEPDPWEDRVSSENAAATTTVANSHEEDVLARRREICATKATGDWKSAALDRLAQERQNAWYGRWVSELVRVAKAGAPVVVEQVSDPYCGDAQHVDEWGGGVPHAFWQEGIARYGWDVDPESLDFEADALFPDQHRYHVFMRKRHRVAD